MKYVLIFCLSFISFIGISQSIEGFWATYNDETGKLESEVQLYIKDGKLYGKLIKLYDVDSRNARCEQCTDYRKDQPIIGMVFMTGLTLSGKEWSGSKSLLDPKNGKLYDGKVWLENDDKLAVRGYLGWFYRTQYWKRKK